MSALLQAAKSTVDCADVLFLSAHGARHSLCPGSGQAPSARMAEPGRAQGLRLGTISRQVRLARDARDGGDGRVQQ